MVNVVETAGRIIDNVGKVVFGKRQAAELMMIAVLCEGHILLEDVPGIGKTTLAKALAQSLDCMFRRIQCTPDLLPSDVTGASFFNQRRQEFEFRPGPIAANVVLVDELNRATPRTQSSLLECMQERQVTVDGETRHLPRPFLVIATQNPVELEGTFPLPEAQLDRFLIRLQLGYPTIDEETDIARQGEGRDPAQPLTPVCGSEELLAMQQECRAVFVAEPVRSYIVQLARETRSHPSVVLGASPRASLALVTAARALAALRGRDFVLPDDAKQLAPAVLSHRIVLKPEARLRGHGREDVVAAVLAGVPVPVEEPAPA